MKQFLYLIVLLLGSTLACAQSSMQGGVTSGGTINFNGNACGPPLFACSNVSTGNVGTIASIFSSTAPTTTTCSGDCQNTIRYDTTMNPSGTDPYVRLTDATSTCGAVGQSFNATISGGDNELKFSMNDDYLWVSQTGAANCLLHLGLVNNIPQVLNTGNPLVTIAGGSVTPSRVSDTTFYYITNKTQVHKATFNTNATSILTDTQIVDVAAAGVCPGIPSPFTATSSGIFTVSKDDDKFEFILSNNGAQNTAQWDIVWSQTLGCAVVDIVNGIPWAYCTSSCTPSTTSLGTFSSLTGCWGQPMHESIMSLDGNYSFLSPGGGSWNNGVCATHNGASVWQIGTINDQWASDANPPSGSGWVSHSSVATTHSVSNNFTGPTIRPNSNVSSTSQFYGAYSPVQEDWHASWPSGTGYTDALPYIVAADLVNQANGSCGPTSSVYCPNFQHNEVYAIFPNNTVAPYTTARRFGHTFSCGQAPHAVCTGGGDAYFQGQEAIMSCSLDGKYCAIASTMLGSLGNDVNSNPRQDVFLIRLD